MTNVISIYHRCCCLTFLCCYINDHYSLCLERRETEGDAQRGGAEEAGQNQQLDNAIVENHTGQCRFRDEGKRPLRRTVERRDPGESVRIHNGVERRSREVGSVREREQKVVAVLRNGETRKFVVREREQSAEGYAEAERYRNSGRSRLLAIGCLVVV